MCTEVSESLVWVLWSEYCGLVLWSGYCGLGTVVWVLWSGYGIISFQPQVYSRGALTC